MKFTAAQLEAIKHVRGNFQLIACAGSGKAEVVARRVANLLKSGVAPPQTNLKISRAPNATLFTAKTNALTSPEYE